MQKVILFDVLRALSFGAALSLHIPAPSSTEDPSEAPLLFLGLGGLFLLAFLLLSHQIARSNWRWGLVSIVLYAVAFEYILVLALSVHGIKVWL